MLLLQLPAGECCACDLSKRVFRRLCADESSVYLGRGTLPLSELQATKKIPFSKAAARCPSPDPSFVLSEGLLR